MSTEVQKLAQFADLLRAIENGRVHLALSEDLKKICEECSNFALDRGGKASASIDLKLKFKLDGGVFEITAEHTTKLPKTKPERSIFWSTPDNFLTVQNPRQLSIFGPREVVDPPIAEAEVRTV